MKKISTIFCASALCLGFSISAQAAHGPINTDPVLHFSSAAPVHITGFSATPDGNVVDLTWTSGPDTNVELFAVERSRDKKVFELVVQRGPSGKSGRQFDYFDIDARPVEGVTYYRLKQVSTDGSVKYSDVIPVNYRHKSGTIGASIKDRAPGMDFSQIANREILALMRDNNGVEFYSKIVVTHANNRLYARDTQHVLHPGSYVMVATSCQELYARELTVK